jgi:quercetin dioxygenase-like cupin family protein
MFMFEAVESGVNSSDGDVSPGFGQEFLTDGDSIRLVVEAEDDKEEEILEAAEESRLGHFNCSVVNIGAPVKTYRGPGMKSSSELAPKRGQYEMTMTALLPYINRREDPPFRFLGLPTLMRSTGETTNGAFGLMEHWSVSPGWASPYHVHHLEDEAFYILEGEVAFVCDGKWIKSGPGDYVFGPREIPHGFKAIGTAPVRMLILCSPAGFERFVLELSEDPNSPAAPPDMAKLVALAAKYSIDILGPLPDEPGVSA